MGPWSRLRPLLHLWGRFWGKSTKQVENLKLRLRNHTCVLRSQRPQSPGWITGCASFTLRTHSVVPSPKVHDWTGEFVWFLMARISPQPWTWYFKLICKTGGYKIENSISHFTALSSVLLTFPLKFSTPYCSLPWWFLHSEPSRQLGHLSILP